MILAMRMQRGSPMPFLMDRHQIQPQARRTSSIRQSFGKGGAGPCRHGHEARGSRSAGTPSTTLMTIVPGELHYRWAMLADPLRFDTSSQPLTRADCGKAGMLWNEGANVCTDSTSTVEANLTLVQAKALEVRGDALADLGGSESKSTKSSASPAALHSSEITAMESPGEVKTAAPPKLKTAKSSTSSRPKVHASKASSKSKHVKSGGSRGRVVAKLATKISVKTASSKSSVKNVTTTASNSSLKSASKRSMKTVMSRRIPPRVASAYKRGARVRSAATTAANSHFLVSAPRFMKSAQAGPANNASR